MTTQHRNAASDRRRLRYLVATVPAAGHVHPAVPVARELVTRGHDVRWLTGTGFRDLVESVGAVFEPLVHSHDPANGDAFNDRFPERASLSGLAGIRFDIKHVFLDELPKQVRDVQRVLATYPADVVVADTGFMGAPVQHELGGPPWASIGITPLTIHSRDVAPFGPGLPPPRTRLGRLRSTVLAAGMRAVMRDVEKHHTAVRAEVGLPASPKGVFDAVASPYLYLQTGTKMADYPRSDLPPQVHYVGPLVSSGLAPEEPTDWKRLAGDRPIIVLTQGTVATDADSLIGPGLRALAKEDVFVVAIGTAVPAELPLNAVHQTYLPYEQILPHASAMLTNGGFGGVQIALKHGVPLAVGGTTEDKPEVAARVAWSGAGINLRTASPSEDAIRDAIQRLLTDENLRAASRRIAEDYSRHDAPRTAADLLEKMADTTRAESGPHADHTLPTTATPYPARP